MDVLRVYRCDANRNGKSKARPAGSNHNGYGRYPAYGAAACCSHLRSVEIL